MARPKQQSDAPTSKSDSGWFSGLPRGQRAVVMVSMVVMLIGISLQAWAWMAVPGDATPAAAIAQDDGSSGDDTSSLPDGLSTGFVEQPSNPDAGDDDTQPAAESGDESTESEGWIDAETIKEWSPVIFTLGFSFFVGFAIGAAVRAFLKMAIIVIGVMLLLLFGLQYAGVIAVDWSVMEGHYDRIVEWLKNETSGFKAFIQGALPSSAMAATGLFFGFRKK